MRKRCTQDFGKTLKRYFGCPDESLEIVGVTGTNGKTTVSTLVRHLLEEETTSWFDWHGEIQFR